jgi:hypothetical protein
VIGDGAEQVGLVRLTFTGGSAIEDRVENGVVLFFASRSPPVPVFDQLTEVEWSGPTHKRLIIQDTSSRQSHNHKFWPLAARFLLMPRFVAVARGQYWD